MKTIAVAILLPIGFLLAKVSDVTGTASDKLQAIVTRLCQ